MTEQNDIEKTLFDLIVDATQASYQHDHKQDNTEEVCLNIKEGIITVHIIIILSKL